MSGYARHWGQGAAPALLLHCSLASSGAWDGVARALADHLSATAPDLIGHGRGPDWDGQQDFHDQNTEYAARFLPEGRCHLIGHSFGATIALRLAEEHPQGIASLTLIEPVLFAAARGRPGHAAHEQALAGLDPAFRADDRAAAARVFLSVWGEGPEFDDLSDPQQRNILDRIHLIAASNGALHDDTARILPRLGQVTAPTLLLAGGDCAPVIPDILDHLEAGLPDATRASVSGAGHMLPITHPAQVAAEIAAHITAHPV
ncbi:alpha/beta hydrolase [Rhodophyticola sp. CCM32]|uniref:alpha/beta fold hydrolase n=1 Tax=Rhodophyticola sp. CCM32 TaxID=2916397 RepID=UPI00107F8A30|nr:alpha/beta hydrolase [Rhodophyticola sp. CCM32]QBX99688.1 alpha/beta hydrolase [Rhodophyticola sp. CCM32]